MVKAEVNMNFRYKIFPIFLFVLLLILENFSLAFCGNLVWVRGYFRKDGTYVRPHFRTAPDGNPFNNFSFPGNFNLNTGRITPGNPLTYLERYYNRKSYNSFTYPNFAFPELKSFHQLTQPTYNYVYPKLFGPDFISSRVDFQNTKNYVDRLLIETKTSNYYRNNLHELFGPNVFLDKDLKKPETLHDLF